MMNIKGIFAVSLIAMVAMVAGAHTSNAVAAIASKGYVDEQVGLKANATELERKVDIYQGDAKANQAVITNGTGNITTGFITKSMLGADVEIPAAITVDSALSSTSTNPVQNKVINTALAGKEVTSNKVKSVRAVASATDTAYPSEKAVATALATKANTSALSGYATIKALDAVENTALAAQSDARAAQEAANAKVATAQGLGNENKAVITDSSGNVTTGQIASGMIANDAVTADKIADGVIPTVNNATLTIKKNGTPVGTFTANASEDNEIDIEVPEATTASDILTTTTVTSSGTGAVLTGVSVTAGKVTLQKGNVQIPSGGQNATSYVSIWVE